MWLAPAGRGPSYSLNDCWLGGDPRLNPSWGSDQLTDSGGDSWYNALQVLLTRRLRKGLQAQASYTYGRVIDDLQGQAGGETNTTPIYPEYVQDIALERGPATFDVTHNFRFTGIYKFPAYNSQKGVLGTALSGWQITGVLTLQSGYPFTPSLQTNFSKSGSSGGSNVVDRPSLAARIHVLQRGSRDTSSAVPRGNWFYQHHVSRRNPTGHAATLLRSVRVLSSRHQSGEPDINLHTHRTPRRCRAAIASMDRA